MLPKRINRSRCHLWRGPAEAKGTVFQVGAQVPPGKMTLLGQRCSHKKEVGGTPETRLRQRFLNNLGLHTRTLIHVRKTATADLWSCPAIQLLVFECLFCSVLFCSLAVLDPRVGHTMDVLSPFIPVLCPLSVCSRSILILLY